MKLPITMWAAEDRPIYKAERTGIESLTNSELLSLIIGSGKVDVDAMELSRTILHKCDNSLKALLNAPTEELSTIKGIGANKAARIKASLELGRRINYSGLNDAYQLSSPKDVYKYMLPVFGHKDVEEFWCIYLNNNFNVLKKSRISVGGLTEVCADIRIILKQALLCNATQIFALHNHPSGSLRPSAIDNKLTEVLKKGCDCMRIRLADHIIITNAGYYSYHENGAI